MLAVTNYMYGSIKTRIVKTENISSGSKKVNLCTKEKYVCNKGFCKRYLFATQYVHVAAALRINIFHLEGLHAMVDSQVTFHGQIIYYLTKV